MPPTPCPTYFGLSSLPKLFHPWQSTSAALVYCPVRCVSVCMRTCVRKGVCGTGKNEGSGQPACSCNARSASKLLVFLCSVTGPAGRGYEDACAHDYQESVPVASRGGARHRGCGACLRVRTQRGLPAAPRPPLHTKVSPALLGGVLAGDHPTVCGLRSHVPQEWGQDWRGLVGVRLWREGRDPDGMALWAMSSLEWPWVAGWPTRLGLYVAHARRLAGSVTSPTHPCGVGQPWHGSGLDGMEVGALTAHLLHRGGPSGTALAMPRAAFLP